MPATSPADRLPWRRLTRALTAAPFAALLAYKPTRHFAVTLTDENQPVELLTFLLMMMSAAQSLLLARRLGRVPMRPIWRAFYLGFGLLLFLTAMEEMSWGQWFFHFRPAPAVDRI